MYKLIFKGKDVDPLFLEDEKGKVILDAYLKNKSLRLMANGQAFSTSDIKSIFEVQKTRAEQPNSHVDQEYEYQQFRKKMLALPIEKRADILRIAKMIWSSVSTEEMPQGVKEEIKKRQLAYFTEKPNCIYANPKIYRDLIPQPREVAQRDNVKPVKTLTPPAILRFIENAIKTDLVYAANK